MTLVEMGTYHSEATTSKTKSQDKENSLNKSVKKIT